VVKTSTPRFERCNLPKTSVLSYWVRAEMTWSFCFIRGAAGRRAPRKPRHLGTRRRTGACSAAFNDDQKLEVLHKGKIEVSSLQKMASCA